MIEMSRDVLFINRNTLSDVAPKIIAQQPKKAFIVLFNGHLRIIDNELLKYYPLIQRGFFGTVMNSHQRGNFSYNILIALPKYLRDQMSQITLFQRDTGPTTPLNEIDIPLIWRGINIPDEVKDELLDFSAIYGGETRSKENLKKLFMGRKIAQILRNDGIKN